MHSGGSTALFPNKFWQFEHGNHTPTPQQKSMFEHFDKCAVQAGKLRKDKRLIVVHDGDALEGVHHGSLQVITYNKDEQAELHEDLMDHFLTKADFDRKRGDRLYYVRGTESHTDDKEQEIAKSLSAEKAESGKRIFDHLEIEVNGRVIWFVHHGPKKGEGAPEGNALRLWLGRIYWTCIKDGKRPPDMILTGHVHTPVYNTYVMGFHTIHGVICPSWQAKTRFAYKVAPVEKNEIGAVFIQIMADGEIKAPVIMTKETENKVSVRV